MSHALRGETHRRRKREGLEGDDPGLPLPSTSGLECRGVSFNADGWGACLACLPSLGRYCVQPPWLPEWKLACGLTQGPPCCSQALRISVPCTCWADAEPNKGPHGCYRISRPTTQPVMVHGLRAADDAREKAKAGAVSQPSGPTVSGRAPLMR